MAWRARAATGRSRALLLLAHVDQAGAALDEASRLAAQAPPDAEHATEIILVRSLVAQRLHGPAEGRRVAAPALASMAARPQASARLRALSEHVRRELGGAARP